MSRSSRPQTDAGAALFEAAEHVEAGRWQDAAAALRRFALAYERARGRDRDAALVSIRNTDDDAATADKALQQQLEALAARMAVMERELGR